MCRVGVSICMNRFYSCIQMRGFKKKVMVLCITYVTIVVCLEPSGPAHFTWVELGRCGRRNDKSIILCIVFVRIAVITCVVFYLVAVKYRSYS